jgi:hypothetical protein
VYVPLYCTQYNHDKKDTGVELKLQSFSTSTKNTGKLTAPDASRQGVLTGYSINDVRQFVYRLHKEAVIV